MGEVKKRKLGRDQLSAAKGTGVKKRETELIRGIVGRGAIIHNRGKGTLAADVNATGGPMSNHTAYDCAVANNVEAVNSNVNALATAE